jgi:hypothetical protein
VIDAVQAALAAGGYAVHVVRAADDGDFAELHISRDDQTTQLDLGRDWRAHDAVPLKVGPVLHLDDAVGSKTAALLGRALPRDFIDIAAALDRYSRRQLLELAFTRDRGLRVADAALAARQLDRLDDAQFLSYQLSGQDVAALRDRFSSWLRDADTDDEAQAAHNAARPPPPSAAKRAAAGFPTPATDVLQQPPACLAAGIAKPTATRQAVPTQQVTTPGRGRSTSLRGFENELLKRARARATTPLATRWSPSFGHRTAYLAP